MLRNIYITLIYMLFLFFGSAAPFVLSLGYIWVDTFDPQAVATDILGQFPVSLVMGIAALGSYAVFDGRKGRFSTISILLIAFAIWITITTAFFAEVPAPAWYKWNHAFKTICFAAFLPFVFRSRVQIESCLLIYVFSMAVQFMPVGAKTFISGGGYGRELGIVSGNTLLSEGATLSAVALMLVPIILHLRSYSLIVPKIRATQLAYVGLAALAIAGAAGTYERTALVGMVVGGVGLWLKTKRKLVFGILGVVGVMIAATYAGQAWTNRISTVKDYNSDTSALGRILVWKWTLGYVAQHPLGGGFDLYRINVIEFPSAEDGQPPIVVHGKAFHSVYFEVLGEQGFPGLALFLTLIGVAVFQLHGVARRMKGIEELRWARDLAQTLQISIATLMSCGAFVGIAFQPMIYNLLALSACLHMHVKRVEEDAAERRAPKYPPLEFDTPAESLIALPAVSGNAL